MYFISDAHLGLGSKEAEREKESRLIAFLEHIKHDASQLFIVGDLFDAWFEYRTVMPKGFYRLFAKFDELIQHGITIHYLAGNHDFWMRNFFSDELGIKTYPDGFETTIDGKRIYIHHGDGLSNNDTGYKILKKLLRSPACIWLYSWVHPDIGVLLASSTSKKSRHYTSTKDYSNNDGMTVFAKNKFEEGVDIVILGHRHKPVCETIGQGTYINLGDWITHNTYAELDRGIITLHEWKHSTTSI